jgi:hypothetical protein
MDELRTDAPRIADRFLLEFIEGSETAISA